MHARDRRARCRSSASAASSTPTTPPGCSTPAPAWCSSTPASSTAARRWSGAGIAARAGRGSRDAAARRPPAGQTRAAVTPEEILAAGPGARLAPVRVRCPRATDPYVVEQRRRVCGCGWPTAGSWSTACRRWWAAIHGYRHPVLDAAVTRPARPDEPRHVRRAHPRAGRAAGPHAWSSSPRRAWSTSSSPTPARSASRSRSRCACSTSASRGRPEKRRLLTWRGGYHGDTFHPMSVCDPDGGMHALWRGVLPRQVFADRPPGGFDARPTRRTWPRWPTRSSRHADELAAVIVEPVVQGAGGMRFHHPEYLRVLRELTRRARRAADLRRDRHRVRPHRRAVRRRPRRGHART